MHGAGRAGTERTAAILDHNLRDSPKEKATGCSQTKEHRYERWECLRPDECRDFARFGCDGEGAIGRRDEAAREGDSLALIRIEERGVGATADDGRELPREIGRVADTRVHSLRADGAVHVGGIAKEKRAPDAKAAGNAVMDAIGREPVHAVDLEPQMLDRPARDVVERELVVVS